MDRYECRIDGLKKYQAALLDQMWMCETPSELWQFRQTLTPAMQKEVDVLIRMVHMESVEERIQGMTRFPIVEKLLANIKKRYD